MPINRDTIANGILAGLTAAANHFAIQVKAKISEVNAPSGIADSLLIGQAQRIEGGASIQVTFSHPATFAYEYGSGVHATMGSPGKYIIAPKEKNALAWDLAKWNPQGPLIPGRKFIGIFNDKYVFHFVEHPGVAPRPFISSTIIQERKTIKYMIGK